MSSGSLAPIALFAYNRPLHTARTLEALRANKGAAASHLFIFSDGPKNELARSGVAQVRKLISEVGGFGSVTVVERTQNMGLAASVIDGVSHLCETYGKVIVLEDDLLTSPYFLQYMNDGLDIYENEEKVISIHGYIYPTDRTLPETFFLRGADCWGWATWKRGWELFDADAGRLSQALAARNLQRAFDFDGAADYTGMLQAQQAGTINSWAVCWYASAFLAEKLTLYPGQSLVQNIGNDDSGTHSESSTRFSVALATSAPRVQRLAPEASQAGHDAFAAYFRKNRRTLARRAIGRLARMFGRRA